MNAVASGGVRPLTRPRTLSTALPADSISMDTAVATSPTRVAATCTATPLRRLALVVAMPSSV
jgi:hypothetical protein